MAGNFKLGATKFQILLYIDKQLIKNSTQNIVETKQTTIKKFRTMRGEGGGRNFIKIYFVIFFFKSVELWAYFIREHSISDN